MNLNLTVSIHRATVVAALGTLLGHLDLDIVKRTFGPIADQSVRKLTGAAGRSKRVY